MVDVDRYLLYETTPLLVTHSGSSSMEFLDEFPLEKKPLGPAVPINTDLLATLVKNNI